MMHSDDDGLVLPPRLAPKHAVLLPIYRNDADRVAVLEYCHSLKKELEAKEGRTYVVEYKNNLTDPSWTPLETVIGDGLEHRVADPGPLPAARFYRVRMTTP